MMEMMKNDGKNPSQQNASVWSAGLRVRSLLRALALGVLVGKRAAWSACVVASARLGLA